MKLGRLKIPNMEYEIGDRIYPIENGSLGWFKRLHYGVIDKIGKKGIWKSVKWFTCLDCAILYGELLRGEFKKKV